MDAVGSPAGTTSQDPPRWLADIAKAGTPVGVDRTDVTAVRVWCGFYAVILLLSVLLVGFARENGLLVTRGHGSLGRVLLLIGSTAGMVLLVLLAWRGMSPRLATTLLPLQAAALAAWILSSLLPLVVVLPVVAFLLYQAWGVWTQRPKSFAARSVAGAFQIAGHLGLLAFGMLLLLRAI